MKSVRVKFRDLEPGSYTYGDTGLPLIVKKVEPESSKYVTVTYVWAGKEEICTYETDDSWYLALYTYSINEEPESSDLLASV